MLERGWRGGGTSAESTGQIYLGGGTPLQKACGFDDTADDLFRYLVASCGPGADEGKIRLFADRCVDHYGWLTAHGVPFEEGFVPYEDSTMPAPGASLTYTGSERAMPYREIARTLEIPLGTVRSRIARGRALLRHRLATYAEELGYRADDAA